jgi:hypothetical protein
VRDIAHIEMQCNLRSEERVQAIAQLCRQNKMDTVVVETSATITKIQAVKYVWSSPFDSASYYLDYAWTFFLRQDSLFAFPKRRVGNQDDWNPRIYYDDTVPEEPRNDWYWNIRNGLEQICGFPVRFVLNDVINSNIEQQFVRNFDSLLLPVSPFVKVFNQDSGIKISPRYTFDISTAKRAYFDSALALWEIDGTLAESIRIFPNSRFYDRIRLFHGNDSTYTLETRKQGRDASLEYFDISDSTLRAFQRYYHTLNDRVMFRREFLADEVYIHPASRGYIGLSTFSLSCLQGLFGLVFPFSPAFTPSQNLFSLNASPSIISPLGGLIGGVIAASYTGEPWYTHLSDIAMDDGIVWGVPQGMMLYGLIAGESTNLGLMHSVGMGLGILRGALTMRLPETLGLNFAQTQVIQGAGVSGFTLGLGLPLTLGAFRLSNADVSSFRLTAASSILGTLAGYGLGYLAATQQQRPFYGGNGAIFDIPSKLGLAIPLALAFANSSPQKPLTDAQIQDFAAWSVVGQLAGYGIGALFLLNRDFTYQQGLTSLGGGILGAIPGLLVFYVGSLLAESERPQILRTSAVLGTIGFGLGYLLVTLGETHTAENNYRLAEQDRRLPTQSFDDHSSENSFLKTLRSRLNFQFSPIGLAALAVPSALPIGLSLPILNLQYHFREE